MWYHKHIFVLYLNEILSGIVYLNGYYIGLYRISLIYCHWLRKQYELVYYLKKDNYQTINEKLREKFGSWIKALTAQQHLDYFFPLENRSAITELDVGSKDLNGSLNLDGFINLKALDCSKNNLTSLDLSQQGELKELNCSENYPLTTLNLTNNPWLTKLECHDCQLTDLVINNCAKLVEVNCSYNNSLAGSCKTFQNLNELKILNIARTSISSGLEYLPGSLEKISCNDQLKEQLKDYDWDIGNWREFYSQSQKWLDKEYPKGKREKIIELDISKQDLKKGLILLGFANLRKLDCSDNQLTKLDLHDCPNLKFLNISNCSSLEGSLKFLKNLNNLEVLNITNTNLNEGLEYLSESCQKLVINSDPSYNSMEFVKELEKSKCLVTKEDNRYYDFVKFAQWREEKQNGMIASIIPLERLYVIRGNIKQFLKKWGKKYNNNWYDKFNILLTNKKISIELDKLRSSDDPDELWKYRWTIYGVQFIGRGIAVAGAVLTFQDQGSIGGGILAIYPFSELLVSKLEESLKNKESKWKEFLTDADNFSDNYNELSGILTQFEISKLKGGKVNEALKNLDKKITKFLKTFDRDGNNEIDIEELKSKRNELIEDLNRWDEEKKEGEEESKLQAIINAVKKLEKAIIGYRQVSYYGASEAKIEEETINDKKTTTLLTKKEKTKEEIIEEKPSEAVIEIPSWKK